jgi:hypothetical protein
VGDGVAHRLSAAGREREKRRVEEFALANKKEVMKKGSRRERKNSTWRLF